MFWAVNTEVLWSEGLVEEQATWVLAGGWRLVVIAAETAAIDRDDPV